MDALTASDVESELEANRVVVTVGNNNNNDDDDDDDNRGSSTRDYYHPHHTPAFSSAHLRAANEREDFLDRLSGTASESPNSVVNIGGGGGGSGGREENDLSRYENHQSSPLQSPVQQHRQQQQQPLSPLQQQQQQQQQQSSCGTVQRPRPNVDALLELLDDAAATRISAGSAATTSTIMNSDDTTETTTIIGRQQAEEFGDAVDGRIAVAEEIHDEKTSALVTVVTNGDNESSVEINSRYHTNDSSDRSAGGGGNDEDDNRFQLHRTTHPPTDVDAIIDEMRLNQTEAASAEMTDKSSLIRHLTVETDHRYLDAGGVGGGGEVSPGASPTPDSRQQQLTPNFPLGASPTPDSHHQPLTPNFPLVADNQPHPHSPFGNEEPSSAQSPIIGQVGTIVER